MNRKASNIVYILTHHTTVGIIVGLALLFVLSSTAQGDWLTMTKDDTTIGVLQGEIDREDETIPEADRYVISSPGGLFIAGYNIADKLNTIGKPVFFNQAYSAAAYIVCRTNAKPLGKNATLGFHWAQVLEPEQDNPEVTEMINTIMLQAMLDIVPVKVASKIIGQMHLIYDKDQINSMILFNVNTGKITTIIEGNKQ